ncbi:MAG TPA: HAMP domain-containing sensor histidine kinase, partial [Candidatus Saccharimonadales bacterium]|nr:HAMP domain-containing sensor histidine kinase [Candidatus Saccharimonadales bacterium]
GSVLYAAIAGLLASSGREVLDTRMGEVRHFLQDGRGLPPTGAPIGISIGGPASGTFAFIIAANDQAVGPPDVALAGLPDQASLAAARQGQTDVRDLTVQGIPLRVLSRPVTAGNGASYVIQVYQDTSGEQRILNVVVLVLVGGGLVALFGALVVGGVYSGRALVPIRDSLQRQREFAADASHEFRTPLAVIRASVEHLERHADEPVNAVGDALGDIRDEADHLTALVGDLLLLARTDSGVVELEAQPLDLAEIGEESIRSVNTLAAQRQVRVELDPEPVPLVGDPLRLRQLITILADNAIKHSPEAATVTVRIRRAGEGATIQVDDQGPGVRAEDMPHVFDRFWRALGAPAGGTGLGLSIAAWIAQRSGGSIGVTNRPEGGARFEVRLPPRPS